MSEMIAGEAQGKKLYARKSSGLVRTIGVFGAMVFGVHCISLWSSGLIPFSWVAGVWPGSSIIGVLTVAMFFCLFHAYTYSVIGATMPQTLVGLGFISRHDLERFFQNTPPTPKNVAQTGIKPQFLVDLLLKIGHVSAGIFTIPEMSEKIKLPPGVTDELVEIARAEKLVAVRSAAGYSRATHVFEITPVARERLQTVLMQSSYAGPAPVPLRDYNLMVARQSIRQVEVDASWVRNSLRDLVVNEQMISQLGPAFNSGRSIFLYGPAGTGKSTIAQMMSQALPAKYSFPTPLKSRDRCFGFTTPRCTFRRRTCRATVRSSTCRPTSLMIRAGSNANGR